MKATYILRTVLIGAVGVMMSSCNDFLDRMPDNRTTIDNEDKVSQLLVSAYSTSSPMMVTEAMSDNCDQVGFQNPYTDRFLDQCFAWDDITEASETNDSPEQFWQGYYNAIASANQALEGVQTAGGPNASTTLKECYAEALLCRAYNHFMLTNLFTMGYNSKTADKDMGVPYCTAPETKLLATYDRGTVAEDYEKMDADIQEALKYLGDTHYTQPKYHFNTQAAYAFACRFYLYYEKWDKAIQYANDCIGETASRNELRDYETMSGMPQGDDALAALERHYTSSDRTCNLLLLPVYSGQSLFMGPYAYYKKYAHSGNINANESANAAQPWSAAPRRAYYEPINIFTATNANFAVFARVPYEMEITDPVTQTGFIHTTVPALTTDEVLLNRAEAYALTGQNDKCVADLNLWASNQFKNHTTMTAQSIQKFYSTIDYAYDDDTHMAGTVRKHLHPDFTIGAEGSVQESLLQAVLNARRVETLEWGMRWFDVKRYGIVIPRRVLGSDGTPARVTDWLKVDDPRRAIQLPTKVIAAGMPKNPRN